MTTQGVLPELAILVKGWQERIDTVTASVARGNDAARWKLERGVLRNVSAEMDRLVDSINKIVAANNDAVGINLPETTNPPKVTCACGRQFWNRAGFSNHARNCEAEKRRSAEFVRRITGE